MKRNKIKSKKGSYIMEAAIVLPIIILTTITLILIIMFFCNQMMEQCELHMKLRERAGFTSGQTIYIDSDGHNENIGESEITCEKTLLGGKAYGKKYILMDNRGILRHKGVYCVEGRSFSMDGTRYVRYCRFIKGDADG